MIMLILDSPYTDPRYNIAAEEFLLMKKAEDYAFFYINQPSVIIGKHQNAWGEVNTEFIRAKGIPVIRRISGGGTVYHDPGNLNFSFILNGKEGRMVDFRKYASPVVEFLVGLTLNASFGKRNEILLGDLKVSGNAEHVHRKRVLHHGTLLFKADLVALETSIRVDPGKYKDKAVQSIRSRVTNITDHLSGNMDMEGFRASLIRHFLDRATGSAGYEFSREDEAAIRELAEDKYSSWDWNIGYSPKYDLNRDFLFDGKQFSLSMHVEKGIIREIGLEAEGVEKEYLDAFCSRLKGNRHDPGLIRQVCQELKIVNPGLIDRFVLNLF